MNSKTPQWLYSALDEALVSAGATADEKARRTEVARVLNAWNMPGRCYHNGRYLASMLEFLDELAGAVARPELLVLAAAYRGALEEIGWEESVSFPFPAVDPVMVDTSALKVLGVPQASVERIVSLVDQLSRHDAQPDDFDAQILIDADLASLASPPQEYRELLAGLRAEASHLDDITFLTSRRNVVSTLLEGPQIFSTPLAFDLDTAARQNLEAELAGIDRRLKRQDERDAADRLDFGKPHGIDATAADALTADAQNAGAPKDEEQGIVAIDPPPRRSRKAATPKVIRASRAQKIDSAMKAAAAAPEDDRNGAGKQPSRLEHYLHPDEDEGAGTYNPLLDTSTLESVADLIEGRTKRKR